MFDTCEKDFSFSSRLCRTHNAQTGRESLFLINRDDALNAIDGVGLVLWRQPAEKVGRSTTYIRGHLQTHVSTRANILTSHPLRTYQKIAFALYPPLEAQTRIDSPNSVAQEYPLRDRTAGHEGG